MTNFASHVTRRGHEPGHRPADLLPQVVRARSAARTTTSSGPPTCGCWTTRSRSAWSSAARCRSAPTSPRTTSPTTSPGLVVTNDVSARDVQLPKTQFYEAKSYPTFTPVGPALVLLDADELKRFTDLRLRLWVNGELRQDMTVADMIYPPVQALQALTRFQRLDAGRPRAHRHPGRHRAAAPRPSPSSSSPRCCRPRVKWKLFFRGQAAQPRSTCRTATSSRPPWPPTTARSTSAAAHACGGPDDRQPTTRAETTTCCGPATPHPTTWPRSRPCRCTHAACPSPPTRCSTRAATRWPDRIAVTVLPDAAPLARAAAAQLRRAARRRAPLRQPAAPARRAARRRGRPDGTQLRRADHRDAGRAAGRHRRPAQRRRCPARTSPSCCAAPAPGCSSPPDPSSRPRRGRPLGDLAGDRRARRGPGAAAHRRGGRATRAVPAIDGVRVGYLDELASTHDPPRFAGDAARARRDLAGAVPHRRHHRRAEAGRAHPRQRGRRRLDAGRQLPVRPPTRRCSPRCRCSTSTRSWSPLLAPLFKGQHVVWAGPLGYRDPALFQRVLEDRRALPHRLDERGPHRLRRPGAAPGRRRHQQPALRRWWAPRRCRPPSATSFQAHTGVPLLEGYGLTEATCASARTFPDAPTAGLGRAAAALPAGQGGARRRRRDLAGPARRADRRAGDQRPDGVPRLRRRARRARPRPGRPRQARRRLAGHRRPRPGRRRRLRPPRPAAPRTSSSAAATTSTRPSSRTPCWRIRRSRRPRPSAGPTRTPVRSRSPTSPSPRAPRVGEDELRAWARERVAEPAAAPKTVTVLDALPVTAVGKPYKLAAARRRHPPRRRSTRITGAQPARHGRHPDRGRHPRHDRHRRGREPTCPPSQAVLDRYAITLELTVDLTGRRSRRAAPRTSTMSDAMTACIASRRRTRRGVLPRARRGQDPRPGPDARAGRPRSASRPAAYRAIGALEIAGAVGVAARPRSCRRSARSPAPGCCSCSPAPSSRTCATATGRARLARPWSAGLLVVAYLVVLLGVRP